LKIVIFETKSHVTLTLTSDDLESDIVVNVSSTLTNSSIWFVAALSLIVSVCLFVHGVNEKWLELTTTNSADIYSIAGPRQALTLRSKGQMGQGHRVMKSENCVAGSVDPVCK